ncbi:hypothetical protein JTE90_010727 [Oedothorax gibbosus]|uniref:Uncharacterized protein n=1 Tax=Oedothorax gibbosus TaxID=931172 RepID=A0AAV6UNU6_9ARAC|nr:hypothetical protein JTE90_010727 [Oedothorax gibbosus]
MKKKVFNSHTGSPIRSPIRLAVIGVQVAATHTNATSRYSLLSSDYAPTFKLFMNSDAQFLQQRLFISYPPSHTPPTVKAKPLDLWLPSVDSCVLAKMKQTQTQVAYLLGGGLGSCCQGGLLSEEVREATLLQNTS